MRRALRPLLIAAVVGAAATVGFVASSRLAPDRLHHEIEAWLARVTHAPAEVATLRLVLGFPVRLEGTGLRLYGGALTAEQASARIDVVSLLLGRPRLTRLRLDGAHLSLDRAEDGTWTPPFFRDREVPHPEPVLAPLRVIEGGIRFLLSRPLLADVLVVRRSRLTLRHPSIEPGGAPVTWTLGSVNGRLLHSRLFGDARLFVRVRLVDASGSDRGVLEVQGKRDDEGSMEATLAATGLDLRTLAPYLRSLRPDAQLAGALDGVASFRTAEAGSGRLDLDFGVRRVEAAFPDPELPRPPLRLDDLSLRMQVAFDPELVALRSVHMSAGELDFDLDARFARPLGPDSRTSLTFSVAELVANPETAQSLVGWLPSSAQPRFASLAERLRSGRLVHAELAGTTRLARWGELFDGRLDELPDAMGLSVRLDDVSVQVDPANRLDHLRGRLVFAEGTLEVESLRADLNGGPLPILDLRIENAQPLLAAPAEQRGMTSSARALVGVTPLFEALRASPQEPPDPRSPPPRIGLHIEHLHHPALLWPLRDVDVELQLERGSDGLRFDVHECEWAGVLIDGTVDWQLQPDRRIAVAIAVREAAPGGEARNAGTAAGRDSGPDVSPAAVAPPTASEAADALAVAPASTEAPEAPDALVAARPLPWASGSFEVGVWEGRSWRQREARGRFTARAGTLDLEGVEVAMLPTGRLTGDVRLDLEHPDHVPYEARISVRGGDIATLAPGKVDVLTGRVDAAGHWQGTLTPGLSWLHDADGELSVAASGGTLERSVPPLVAVALASRSLNPFASRESIRYDRLEASFQLAAGRMQTDALEFEGPDLRMFASGSFDWGRTPAEVEAEVALFLFRQLDRALELIPLVNVLLLGDDQNLVAAYFEIEGPWNEPVAVARPLRTLEEGPTAVITQGIPNVMKRGMKALGGLFRSDGVPPPTPAPVPQARVPSSARAPALPGPVAPARAPALPGPVAPARAPALPGPVAPDGATDLSGPVAPPAPPAPPGDAAATSP